MATVPREPRILDDSLSFFWLPAAGRLAAASSQQRFGSLKKKFVYVLFQKQENEERFCSEDCLYIPPEDDSSRRSVGGYLFFGFSRVRCRVMQYMFVPELLFTDVSFQRSQSLVLCMSCGRWFCNHIGRLNVVSSSSG